MIQRHMKDATNSDIVNFDYFNDADDTIKWLESIIAQMPDKREVHRLQTIVDQLKIGLAASQPKSTNLDGAARNPDGSYNGVKALKWISDALGGKLTEEEIKKEWEKAKANKGDPK